MATRKRSRSAAVPPFEISITRRSAAPARPIKAKLAKLFDRAWRIVPIGRRPDLGGARKVVVDIIVVDDAEIAELNAAHLKHEGATDVLSFPMGEFDPERNAYNFGEIVVSFDTARREAGARELSSEEELSRYCVHGFLHLLGYEDDTDTQRQQMFEVQEKALGVKIRELDEKTRPTAELTTRTATRVPAKRSKRRK